MTGSPGTRLAPDLGPGPRAALVIATGGYQDSALSQLRATADDAQALTDVLGDPAIGGFTVTPVIDADERRVRRAIDVFLSGCGTGDVVLIYLSCHGVLDRRNRLYFAAADTIKDQLSSTGIPASWLLEQLEECRARQQVVILDCCFSGAFAKGSKGDGELDLGRRLSGRGRGRAVLTASRSGEYSFMGDALLGAPVSGSVFTAGLVEGLRTGAADTVGDGYITVDEAYDFAYRYVLSLDAAQTPQRWLSGGEGAIVLARSPAGIAIRPATLPEELADALESRYPMIRIGAVHELGSWLAGDDPCRALTAEQKLHQIAENDNHSVATAAGAYLTASGEASPHGYSTAKNENTAAVPAHVNPSRVGNRGEEALGRTGITKPEIGFPEGPPPKKLEVIDIWQGDGKVASAGDTIEVHYVGAAYSTREEFDASWNRGEPLRFRLGVGQVIQGWDQGVQGMKVGGRRKLVIPPEMGYGNRGAGSVIKPGETLIFICDLVSA